MQRKKFLQLLRQLRLDSGITQKELAKRLGLPQSFVSKYESGERRLDILELKAICSVLKIPFPEFARRLDEALSETE